MPGSRLARRVAARRPPSRHFTAQSRLRNHSAVTPLDRLLVRGRGGLVLIGKPPSPAADPAGWARLANRLQNGSTLLFVSADPFRQSPEAVQWLPLHRDGRGPAGSARKSRTCRCRSGR